MWKIGVLLLLVLAMGACKPPEEPRMRAIIGAVLIDGTGGPPVSDSVVVIASGRINAAGPRTSTLVPAAADKIDGSGKFLVPALIDVCARVDPAVSFTAPGGYPDGAIEPADEEAARSRVAELAARKAPAIHLWMDDRNHSRPKLQNAIASAVLAAARAASIPVTGHVATQADAEFLTDHGASSFVGMIRDTAVDPVFVARLRDLRIVVAPALVSVGQAELETAERNTRTLFAAGVPIAVATLGAAPIVKEAELLSAAGIPALDVLVAATKNGAIALGELREAGTIEAGKRADLVILSRNPGEDVRNLEGGERVRY